MASSMSSVEPLEPDALKQLQLFRRQYLQLQDIQFLTWPSSDYLRRANVQEWIYEQCFQSVDDSVIPPERYQLRILKPLLARIENAIVDPEEDVSVYRSAEISDNLMSTMTDIMFAPLPDEATAAQQKSWVTYTLVPPPSEASAHDAAVRLLENRYVISGAGTTGLRTWEAALHLGSYLLSSYETTALVAGRRVIELGAGTGLLALMCAGHLGAKHVIATDGDEGVVEAMKENAACTDLQAEMKIAQLWWGRSVKGTWLEEEFAPDACDLIIGADVTYDKAVIPALVSTMRDMFELWPKVQIIISATIRNEDTFAAFEHACEHNEFLFQEIDYPLVPMTEQSSLFHSTAVPIKIFLISAPKQIKDPFAV
ncbi:putative methyltransferase-domain-containing protein [Delphinella strobiligena]|nr:putative methyltransferase-domain-containing protein [Delphinella strobiligena]